MPFKVIAVLAERGAQYKGPMGPATDWVLRIDTDPASSRPFELTVAVARGTDVQGVKEAAQRCIRDYMGEEAPLEKIMVKEARSRPVTRPSGPG